MIQRLRLSNWRAYDSLDIELGPGATFIVASNGIGKTSLIMAAAWGVFGDIAGVRGADEIRGDAETATVVVDLRLPSAGLMEITRAVGQNGKTQIEATLGDRELTTQDEIDALLALEFGADHRVLTQLTFMIHGGLHETQGEFELRDHLAGLFGVSNLFSAAARADDLAGATASELRKAKIVERKDQRGKEELARELETAQRDLQAAQVARASAVATLNEASDRLRAAREWADYRSALDERETKLTAYAQVAGHLLEEDVDPGNVLEALTRVEADEESAASAAETRAAEARGRSEVIREAAALLGSADAACPTCLRPLSEHEANEAAQEHARHVQQLQQTVAEAEEEAQTRRVTLQSLRSVLTDIRSVAMPVEPSSEERTDSLDAAQATHDAARDALQQHDRDVAVGTAAANTLQEALDEIEENDEITERLEELFRLEALAHASAQTFTETADRIMEQQVEPLIAEVARRWKQTFGRGGLQLSTHGTITRKVGSRTLNFGSLSGGERVWALLVARLLVAGASTNAPFIWLDEPLEHLDPRLRRIVAGTLAMASSRAGIRQVIVTTYEAPIAQQLMEDVPSASLVFVSSAE